MCYLQNDDLLSEQFCKDQSDQDSHHLRLGVVLSLLSLWEQDGFPASLHFHGIRAIAEIIGMFSTDLRP